MATKTLTKDGHPMTQCSTDATQVTLSLFKPQVVTAAFDDGAARSNAGLALLAQLDKELGWTKRLAAGVLDGRKRTGV